MNLADLIITQGRARPRAAALIDRSSGRRRVLTFAQLEAETAAGARLLHSKGVGTGDRILFAQPVSIELYVGLLSALRVGATAVFADLSAGKNFLDPMCSSLKPKAYFGSGRAQLLRFTSPAIRRIPIKFSTGTLLGATRWNTGRADLFPPVQVPGDHPALITFTSGSTGNPKTIARSHRFLLAQNRALSSALNLKSGEVDLVTLPMFALANLASGVTSSLADSDLRYPGDPDTGAVARQLGEDQIRRATASPAFFEALIAGRVNLSPLTQIYTGGAPVFPRLLRSLRDAAPGAKIVSVFGSSEAEPIAHLDAEEIGDDDHRAMREGFGLLAGNPVPEIDLKILPATWRDPSRTFTEGEFEELGLPSGRAGEIVVSGDHVLSGYLHGVGDGENKIRVGDTVWHRTGDAGKLDGRGRLWLLGRCSATIEDTVGTLYPLAAECALSYQGEITRSAVLSHEGQRVAVIEASEPVDLSHIRSAIPWAGIGSVADGPIPLDRRHNAKTDYTRLSSLLESRDNRAVHPSGPRRRRAKVV